MSDSERNLRIEYRAGVLNEQDAPKDPLALFREWLDRAFAENLPEPNAMLVATAALDGKPSARVALLREMDERGLVFFTNYASRKGKELESNPFAALVFFWQPLHRQIRVEGRVERIAAAESDAYFDSRPRGSQLASAASPQSAVIPNRDVLEARVKELEARFPNRVLRPPHWGGYRVIPDVFEFWQGRENRMHDRLQYTRGVGDVWVRERLAP
ncbi:MAG: pyridoxamine 5'-phosphate oxidase [Anaerolineae bacterium]|nr:pyridoxamine 5'-phosphate oxidase [Anaerolineae bacterium]